MLNTRSSWRVTTSVWYAMFIREALARTMADRFAWFWMIFEPAAMVGIMVIVRTVALGADQKIYGADFVPWMILGLFGFFLFRDNMLRPIGAVKANKGLFAYRQVKPVDPVLVRCYLEGLLRTFIFLLFIVAGILLEFDLIPDEPLMALVSWVSLWCLGLGVGLIYSALAGLASEFDNIAKLTSMPLLIISGVMFPLNYLPHDLLGYLMWNPIVHGLESFRQAFFSSYRAIPGTSLLYLWMWVLPLWSLGLLLHIRFAETLKRQ